MNSQVIKFLIMGVVIYILIGKSLVAQDIDKVVSVTSISLDTSRFFIRIDTSISVHVVLREDSTEIATTFTYYGDSIKGCKYRSYLENNETMEYTDYSANKYDFLNTDRVELNKGISVMYWTPGIIEIKNYFDQNGKRQGNSIKCRPDGSLQENRIYRDDIRIKTYFYSTTGALDSLVTH